MQLWWCICIFDFYNYFIFNYRASPDNLEIAEELGLVYLKNGNVHEAFQQFGTILAHSPGCARIILPLGFIIQVSLLHKTHLYMQINFIILYIYRIMMNMMLHFQSINLLLKQYLNLQLYGTILECVFLIKKNLLL